LEFFSFTGKLEENGFKVHVVILVPVAPNNFWRGTCYCPTFAPIEQLQRKKEKEKTKNKSAPNISKK